MIEDKIYRYFERNQRLRVLFVFDAMHQLESDLQQIAWREGYQLVIAREPSFRVKYDIQHQWKDKKIILYLTCPEPRNAESREAFPLMGEMMANAVLQLDDAAEYMQEHGLAEEHRSTIETYIPMLNIGGVGRIIAPFLAEHQFSEDLAQRAIISFYLNSSEMLSWEDIAIALIAMAIDGKESQRNRVFSGLKRCLPAKEGLNSWLQSNTGQCYDDNDLLRMRKVAQSIKYNVLTVHLLESDKDDYRRFKVHSVLANKTMLTLLEHGLRHAKYGKDFVTAFTALSEEIDEEKIFACYGTSANYNYVTARMCLPMMKHIIEGQLKKKPDAVVRFTPEQRWMPLIGDDVAHAINMMRLIARFYLAADAVSALSLPSTANDYVTFYANEFQKVDFAYRKAIEAAVLTEQDNALSVRESLLLAREEMNREYAQLCNDFNQKWMNTLLRDGGVEVLHQEDFYNQCIKPETVKTAVVVVDGLRYEVGMEIMRRLFEEKHDVNIRPAVAMLPTETKYCKTALLPHEHLKLAVDKMEVDGKVLVSTEQRQQQVRKYVPDANCFTFKDVSNAQRDTNRQRFKSRLVYVFYDNIDESGHKYDSSRAVTKACSDAVTEIAKLVKSIHVSFNVTKVFITSDHGFLFNDHKFEEKDLQKINDECIERTSRYYLTHKEAQETNITKFPLNKVSAIEADESIWVAVPFGTNRLSSNGRYNYAHGGASLQEMVIPIIESHIREESIETLPRVDIEFVGTNFSIVSSMLHFTLIQKQAVSADVKPRTVKCALWDKDKMVSDEKSVEINSIEPELLHRVFNVTLTLKDSSASLIELRIYDESDKEKLNPLLRTNVMNKTIVDRDIF